MGTHIMLSWEGRATVKPGAHSSLIYLESKTLTAGSVCFLIFRLIDAMQWREVKKNYSQLPIVICCFQYFLIYCLHTFHMQSLLSFSTPPIVSRCRRVCAPTDALSSKSLPHAGAQNISIKKLITTMRI